MTWNKFCLMIRKEIRCLHFERFYYITVLNGFDLLCIFLSLALLSFSAAVMCLCKSIGFLFLFFFVQATALLLSSSLYKYYVVFALSLSNTLLVPMYSTTPPLRRMHINKPAPADRRTRNWMHVIVWVRVFQPNKQLHLSSCVMNIFHSRKNIICSMIVTE